MKQISIAKLRKLLDYNPTTGVLTWKAWCGNGLTAGKRAGTLKKQKGYRFIKIEGVDYREHRVAWALHYGHWPKRGLDHENLDRTDNRISNLRLATDEQNSRNTPKRTSACGYRGVKRFKDRFQARITVAGKEFHLGMHDTAEAAARTRDAAAIKHHGEFARLNFQ